MVKAASEPPSFQPREPSRQREERAPGGLVAISVIVVGLAAAVGLVLVGGVVAIVGAGVLATVALGAWTGFVVIQPNESVVLILFGRYTGTVLQDGWFWVNPFTAPWRQKISLRVRNFQSERIKVNDASGSPIEIAGVVVWRIADTAKAVFDVEDFEQYVVVQSESALRHLATQYPYDDFEEGHVSLRGGAEEVSAALHGELQERPRRGRHRGTRGAHHPLGVRAGDRRGDAAPPAGVGDRRSAPDDRGRRGRHRRHGAARDRSAGHRRPRR